MGLFDIFKKASSSNADNRPTQPKKDELKVQFKAGTVPPYDNWNVLNSEESTFFCCFSEKLTDAKLSPEKIILTRLSDGAFNVNYSDVCYVGKIKLYKHNISHVDSYAVIKAGNARATRVFQSLQEAENYISSKKDYYVEKRTTVFHDNFYMQYLIGPTQVEHIQDSTLQEYIDALPYWVNYIKYCKRNEL